MRIEILSVPDCPGLPAARAEVGRWLAAQQRTADIREIVVHSEAEAQRWHFRASPTIRINGRDVVPNAAGHDRGGMYCRLTTPEIPHGIS